MRGRVRFTAAAVDFDGDKRTDYRYAVVDVLDVRRGDPWKILPHFRRSFPLLERDSAPGMVAALRCREGQAFLFYVDLPIKNAPRRSAFPTRWRVLSARSR